MDSKALFQLTHAEFEQICVDLMKARGLESIELHRRNSSGVSDIVGEIDGQRVLVEAKHVKNLSSATVRLLRNRVQASDYGPDRLFIVTSAPITSIFRDLIEGQPIDGPVTLIAQDEVLKFLNDQPEVERVQIQAATRRQFRQQSLLTGGVIGALASIAGLLFTILAGFVQPEKPQLQERIETVESAIGSLKQLEEQLIDIREDMADTEKATRIIEQKYAKAQELEKLTEIQLEAVKSALQSQSWVRTAVNYVLGFVLGIASSLIASVIYSRVRHRRSLLEDGGDA